MKSVSKYSDMERSKANISMNQKSIANSNLNKRESASSNSIKNVDYYNTDKMTVLEKVQFYENKVHQIKGLKNNHKTEIQNIRIVKNSTQNVIQFRLDEVPKKMKNEIFRLNEESRRHEDSQKTENQKIQNQINYVSENSDGLNKLLNEILERVVRIEQTLGN